MKWKSQRYEETYLFFTEINSCPGLRAQIDKLHRLGGFYQPTPTFARKNKNMVAVCLEDQDLANTDLIDAHQKKNN